MNGKKFNISAQKPRVLVAPLDWGLGHATRCIPVIKELLLLNCEVLIAAENKTAALLKAEFPALTFIPLKGYEVRYSRSARRLAAAIALQLPKIIRNIHYENKWLKKIAVTHSIDLIISDNRPGLYHKTIPCIYITHQLQIPAGNVLSAWITQKMHYRYINKFSLCLVPDAGGTVNLAGSLSHPKKLPLVPVNYIGPLSRFEKFAVENKYTLLVLLSGPEPQRTIFEQQLLTELKPYTGTCLFIRGLPGETKPLVFENNNVIFENHLPAAALNSAILQSQMVLTRSGYTTVMDLVKLQQKAILVATPGQPEQEYLSKNLLEKRLFYSVGQRDFSLMAALKNAAAFTYKESHIDLDAYRTAIKNIIKNRL